MKEPDARMDNTTAGVFTVDIDRRITFFNKTASAIVGIRPQEALGRHCDEILRAGTCGTGCLLNHTMISGGPVCNVPTTIIRGDGKRVSLGVDICLLKNGAGKVVGGMASFRDLSAILGPS
ncbi:MAG: PAS domain-containing protein [Thermodesulfobacteriota bacterium]|nr:PAS domain-containing protein [Thermodesulfobacteriota bacterium]